MSHRADIGVSLKIIKWAVTLIGLWKTNNIFEDILMILIFLVALSLAIFGAIITATDLFYVLDNIHEAVNILCPTVAILNITVKLIIFAINRHKILNIIERIENTINNETNEEYEISAVKDCERQCITLVITLAISTQGAISNYVVLPFVENFSGNESARILPVELHFGNISFKETPYFEIGLVLEAMVGLSTGICSITLNVCLTITNLHLACQFKILYKKIKWTFPSDLDIMDQDISYYAFTNLKKCIKIHKMLIDYTAQVENACSYIILVQMVSSGILICTAGFQVFFFSGTILKFFCKSSFFVNTIGEFFLFSWSCNEIIEASSLIGDGGYDTTWYTLSATGYGKSFRHGLQILMIRSHRPCYVTAGKFCIISLESFSAVITSAMSYFTLLRTFVDEENLSK